ncbi:hypothetical protein DFJ73DRAFT_793941 [Zopfochytrium polystomum]|nr:hypothetical protein DFJ73DRAFT_793941 [Zopfochytrium polystomum]
MLPPPPAATTSSSSNTSSIGNGGGDTGITAGVIRIRAQAPAAPNDDQVKHPSLSLSVSSSSNSSSSALEPISIDDAVDRDLAEPLAGKEAFESYPDGLVAEGLAPASTLQWIDSVQASVESVIALPGARLVDQLKSAFKDKRFILLLVGSSIAIFHLFVPPFFLPLYANSVGLSTSMSLLVLADSVILAKSTPDRRTASKNRVYAAGWFGFGVFADLLLGSLNSFVVCLFLVGISTLVIWRWPRRSRRCWSHQKTEGGVGCIPAGITTFYETRGNLYNHEFPRGFGMIAGNYTRRGQGGTQVERAVGWICIGRENPGNADGAGIPRDCEGDVRAQVQFPVCADGRGFAGDQSHVSYARRPTRRG